MHSFLTTLRHLLPIIHAWVEKQERIILDIGTPLDQRQREDARRAGVTHPEEIRVLIVDELPHPDHDDIMFIAKQVGLFSERSTGLTLGYGIYLRQDVANDRYTLVHECVHVGQYEKKKSILTFLTEYLRECIDPGYPFGPMEQEALLVARDICKPITQESSPKETLS